MCFFFFILFCYLFFRLCLKINIVFFSSRSFFSVLNIRLLSAVPLSSIQDTISDSVRESVRLGWVRPVSLEASSSLVQVWGLFNTTSIIFLSGFSLYLIYKVCSSFSGSSSWFSNSFFPFPRFWSGSSIPPSPSPPPSSFSASANSTDAVLADLRTDISLVSAGVHRVSDSVQVVAGLIGNNAIMLERFSQSMQNSESFIAKCFSENRLSAHTDLIVLLRVISQFCQVNLPAPRSVNPNDLPVPTPSIKVSFSPEFLSLLNVSPPNPAPGVGVALAALL